MRLSRNEQVGLATGLLLTLAGIGANDPLSFYLFLCLSWLAFLFVCFGPAVARVWTGIVFTVAFSLVAIRFYIHDASQKRAFQFAAELTDPLRGLVIVLSLKTPAAFDDLRPLRAGFLFLGDDANGEIKPLAMSVSDKPSVQIINNLPFYWVNWSSGIERNSEVHGYWFSGPAEPVREINDVPTLSEDERKNTGLRLQR